MAFRTPRGFRAGRGSPKAAADIFLCFPSQIETLPLTGTDQRGSQAASAAKQSLMNWPPGLDHGECAVGSSSNDTAAPSVGREPCSETRVCVQVSTRGASLMKGHLQSILSTHRFRICKLTYLPKCVCYPQTVVPGESLAEVAE